MHVKSIHKFCRKNFRLAYGKLSMLRSFFPTAPVAAFTATATATAAAATATASRKTCRLIREFIL